MNLPLASDSPPWSGPHSSQIGPTYGTLVALPAANDGWTLYFDPELEHFAMTLHGPVDMPSEVEMMHRRWKVTDAKGIVKLMLDASMAAVADREAGR
jgi:hypothetical protein